MKRFLVVLALVGIGVLIASGSAMAVSYPALPPAAYPVIGESLLEDGFDTYIDWVVHYIPASKSPATYTPLETKLTTEIGSIVLDNYTYLYQLEHPSATGSVVPIDEFFIPNTPTGTVLAHGWGDGEDLDDYHTIAGEFEPGGTTLEDVYNSQLNALNTMIWDFESFAAADDGVPLDTETEVMWLVSSMRPQYVDGRSEFSGNPSDPTIGQVPGPAPEPASATLLGIGLLGALGARFRKRRKK